MAVGYCLVYWRLVHRCIVDTISTNWDWSCLVLDDDRDSSSHRQRLQVQEINENNQTQQPIVEGGKYAEDISVSVVCSFERSQHGVGSG